MNNPDTLAAIRARRDKRRKGYRGQSICQEHKDVDALLAALDEANKERDALKAALERAPQIPTVSPYGRKYNEWYDETRELLK